MAAPRQKEMKDSATVVATTIFAVELLNGEEGEEEDESCVDILPV